MASARAGQHRTRLEVVFRVAAGPRQGYGHLVRAGRIARALGVPWVVSLRGGPAARSVARELGGIVDERPVRELIDERRPAVLVIDDPIRAPAEAAIRAARRAGVATLGVHDLGRGCLDADLVVDGSLPGGPALARVVATRCRTGPRYAVVDPFTCDLRRRANRRPRWDIVVSLGGGGRATVALALARLLVQRNPAARVAVATGFAGRPRGTSRVVRWPRGRSIVCALADSRVAVLGGGVTAYEAAALGVPAVLVDVVRAQRPTVRAFALRGAAVAGGSVAGKVTSAALERLAVRVERLFRTPARQRAMAAAGRRLVDGRGAARVAALVARLAGGRR
jgi:spore coat polysaccharide biosynthesis predicted glycosyltransferase SpsG